MVTAYDLKPIAQKSKETEEDAQDHGTSPHSCLVSYRDVLRPVAPGDDSNIRIEYTCVHISYQYLVCGSNTGVVDVYRHDGAGGNCRLQKALIPPKGSQHVNVKVTCIKLDPTQRILAVGNILGAVNVLLLNFDGGQPQRLLHSHILHQGSVRCLAWDDLGQRLYSGCDGGTVVEMLLARHDGPSEHGAGGGDSVAGGGRGGSPGRRSLGPLLGLFQASPSSSVLHQEESDTVQLIFLAVTGPLPSGMQRAGDIPADGILLASHARRCNVHLLNRTLSRSLLYSIQVEGGGTATSGKSIYGATLQPLMDSRGQQLEKLYLYVGRPRDRFWVIDLGSENAVQTLAPLLVPTPLPADHDPADGEQKDAESARNAPSAGPFGGRLVMTRFPPPGGPCLLSWSHSGGLALISLERLQTLPIWGGGAYDLAVLPGSGAVLTLAVLRGREKAVGMLNVSLEPADGTDGRAAERREAAALLQRAWRSQHARQAEKMRLNMERVLGAVREVGERARTHLSLPSEQHASQEPSAVPGSDPGAAKLLGEAEALCADVRQFLARAAPASDAALGKSALDSTSSKLMAMAEELLLESRRVLFPRDECAASPRISEYNSGSVTALPSAMADLRETPVLYGGLGQRWRERQEGEVAGSGIASLSRVAGVEELEGGGANVGSAISALAALEYEVQLVASGGLGLDLAFVGNGVVVRGLAFLADGRPSPAQLCGRIRAGDALLAVNGIALEPLALKDKLGVLLALAREEDTEILLRFMAKEASSWTRSLVGLGLGGAGGSGGGPAKEERSPSRPGGEPSSLSFPPSQAPAALMQDQERAIEKILEMGVTLPKHGLSNGADQLRHQQSLIQHFLTSTLLPWKSKIREEEEKSRSTQQKCAIAASEKKRWGEFFRSDMSLGLVLAAEEMENDLDRIARDVRTLWTTMDRANDSRFYDDQHFGALLSRVQALASNPPADLKMSLERCSAHARIKAGGRTPRDIAREYLGLLYFKDLLRTTTFHSQGKAAITSKKGIEYRAKKDEELEPKESSAALYEASMPESSPCSPIQVYLEAVPLTDVLAELSDGVRENIEQVGKESQDLEAAMEVLTHVLEATLAEMVGCAGDKVAAEDFPFLAGGKPWPPVQLTHVTGMAIAVQQAHAILSSSETMLQEWLRCFQPLPPSQRHMIWDSSDSFLSQHIHPDDAEMIRQHHLLTCELATLYFQMHTVWPLLEKSVSTKEQRSEKDDNRDGTEEVRLDIAGGCAVLDGGGRFDASLGILHVGSRRGERMPTQWQEEEALAFLEEYGAYVMLEGAVKACLARGFELALWYLVRNLGPQEGRFQQAEKALVQRLTANKEDELALVRHVQETAFPLSLAVAILPEVVASPSFGTPTVVTELHRVFFPHLRPWLIRNILAARGKEKVKVDPYAGHTFATAALLITRNVDEAWRDYHTTAGLKAITATGQDVGRTALSPLDDLISPMRCLSTTIAAAKEGNAPPISDEGSGVPRLQAALRQRLELLRRAIVAGDLMTRIQTHIWDMGSASSAVAGLNVLPPSLLGIALVENGTRGPQLSTHTPSKEEGMREPPAFSVGIERDGAKTPSTCAWNPVEGQGGVGIVHDLAEEYLCGVCQLDCCREVVRSRPTRHRGHEHGTEEVRRLNGDAEGVSGEGCSGAGDGKSIVFFTCGHAFHSLCLQEKACVVCLRGNFPPL